MKYLRWRECKPAAKQIVAEFRRTVIQIVQATGSGQLANLFRAEKSEAQAAEKSEDPTPPIDKIMVK